MLLADRGLVGKRLGIETESKGLTVHMWEALRSAIGQEVTPADEIFRVLRRVKSPAEIEMHRRAAALSDNALDAAHWRRPGLALSRGTSWPPCKARFSKVAATMRGTSSSWGQAPGALLCRYYSGRRHLDERGSADAGMVWRLCPLSRGHDAHAGRRQGGQAHSATCTLPAVEALEACEDAIRPGEPMGKVFDAHAKVFDAHGLRPCPFASLRLWHGRSVYNPLWVDFPMFYEGNPLDHAARPGVLPAHDPDGF